MGATQVLVVGAGPTGLNLALRLARRGVAVRVVAKAPGPGRESRAMVVHARTLEFYGQLGFADAVVEAGIKVEAAHLRAHGTEVVSVAFGDVGAGLSPYPFVLCYPQDDHERFLLDRLTEAGIRVEWNTELVSLTAGAERVTAELSRDGRTETCETAYLCGCDGAHTAVRPALGIAFPGGTYEQLFYVADTTLDVPPTGDLFVHLGERTLALRLPVRSGGHHRLIGIVPPDLEGRERLAFDDVRPSAEALLGVRVREVGWFSTYRVHHRVASRFRAGRVFIAGDAGHLHSPAGGQGMNTGIGDAINLAWKLADVLDGRAHPALLDSYEAERLPFARALVRTTDRAFEALVGRGWSHDLLRRWIVPRVAPALTSVPALRRGFFGRLSQTAIHYRDSPISAGRAGAVRGGDRLPWTGTNYASLDGLAWRLHVYGEPDADLRRVAGALSIPVDVFPTGAAAERAGLARDSAFLVRPDGHVALALPRQEADALSAFWSTAVQGPL